jgi:hypothetical protein
MGDYECINCNEIFHKDEPAYDGHNLCELCRQEMTDEGVIDSKLFDDLYYHLLDNVELRKQLKHKEKGVSDENMG